MLGFVTRLARLMALLGGFVLTALVALTCVSVLGRGLNAFGHSDFVETTLPGFGEWLIGTGVGPILGDYELVQAGIAFAIFAFLPICQLHGGHATVDVFTNMMPKKINRFIIVFWEVLLTIVLVLISWRLYEGLAGKMRNGETTFLLQFPIWWAYAASFAASLAAAIVGIYCACARVAGLITGGHYLPKSEGAVH